MTTAAFGENAGQWGSGNGHEVAGCGAEADGDADGDVDADGDGDDDANADRASLLHVKGDVDTEEPGVIVAMLDREADEATEELDDRDDGDEEFTLAAFSPLPYPYTKISQNAPKRRERGCSVARSASDVDDSSVRDMAYSLSGWSSDAMVSLLRRGGMSSSPLSSMVLLLLKQSGESGTPTKVAFVEVRADTKQAADSLAVADFSGPNVVVHGATAPTGIWQHRLYDTPSVSRTSTGIFVAEMSVCRMQ